MAGEARAQLEGGVGRARADVRTGFEELRRAEAAAAAARDAARLAVENLELVDIGYRGGATTNIEVVDAERRARDAQAAAALAEDAAQQARLDVLVASGRFPQL